MRYRTYLDKLRKLDRDKMHERVERDLAKIEQRKNDAKARNRA